MGNTPDDSLGEDWVRVKAEAGREVYQHRLCNERIERVQVQFSDSAEFQRECRIFTRRKRPGPNVAEITDLVVSQEKYICSECVRGQLILPVYEQRLSDLSRLEEERALFILSQSLKGFQEVSSMCEEQFQIYPSMIAVTEDDAVKVWLNEDFSKNYPMLSLPTGKGPAEQESRAVGRLFAILGYFAEGRKFSQHFQAYVESRLSEPYSYEAAIAAIGDYARLNCEEEDKLSFPSVNQVEQPRRLSYLIEKSKQSQLSRKSSRSKDLAEPLSLILDQAKFQPSSRLPDVEQIGQHLHQDVRTNLVIPKIQFKLKNQEQISSLTARSTDMPSAYQQNLTCRQEPRMVQQWAVKTDRTLPAQPASIQEQKQYKPIQHKPLPQSQPPIIVSNIVPVSPRNNPIRNLFQAPIGPTKIDPKEITVYLKAIPVQPKVVEQVKPQVFKVATPQPTAISSISLSSEGRRGLVMLKQQKPKNSQIKPPQILNIKNLEKKHEQPSLAYTDRPNTQSQINKQSPRLKRLSLGKHVDKDLKPSQYQVDVTKVEPKLKLKRGNQISARQQKLMNRTLIILPTAESTLGRSQKSPLKPTVVANYTKQSEVKEKNPVKKSEAQRKEVASLTKINIKPVIQHFKMQSKKLAVQNGLPVPVLSPKSTHQPRHQQQQLIPISPISVQNNYGQQNFKNKQKPNKSTNIAQKKPQILALIEHKKQLLISKKQQPKPVEAKTENKQVQLQLKTIFQPRYPKQAWTPQQLKPLVPLRKQIKNQIQTPVQELIQQKLQMQPPIPPVSQFPTKHQVIAPVLVKQTHLLHLLIPSVFDLKQSKLQHFSVYNKAPQKLHSKPIPQKHQLVRLFPLAVEGIKNNIQQPLKQSVTPNTQVLAVPHRPLIKLFNLVTPQQRPNQQSSESQLISASKLVRLRATTNPAGQVKQKEQTLRIMPLELTTPPAVQDLTPSPLKKLRGSPIIPKQILPLVSPIQVREVTLPETKSSVVQQSQASLQFHRSHSPQISKQNGNSVDQEFPGYLYEDGINYSQEVSQSIQSQQEGVNTLAQLMGEINLFRSELDSHFMQHLQNKELEERKGRAQKVAEQLEGSNCLQILEEEQPEQAIAIDQ